MRTAPDHAGQLTVVERWRAERLLHGGFPAALAHELAGQEGYDIHALLELVDRGCPPELAARILAPLDQTQTSRP